MFSPVLQRVLFVHYPLESSTSIHSINIFFGVHSGPDIKTKKFLIDGVGHNDVNIQFIGLRIFMQYQRDLQAETSDPDVDDESIEAHIDIDDMVQYLDNPPQFDVAMRRVQNFGPDLITQSLSEDKVKKGSGSTFDSLTEEGTETTTDMTTDTTTASVEVGRRVNEWDEETRTFIGYRGDLPSKTYHLSLFMRKQEEGRRKQESLGNGQMLSQMQEENALFVSPALQGSHGVTYYTAHNHMNGSEHDFRKKSIDCLEFLCTTVKGELSVNETFSFAPLSIIEHDSDLFWAASVKL